MASKTTTDTQVLYTYIATVKTLLCQTKLIIPLVL